MRPTGAERVDRGEPGRPSAAGSAARIRKPEYALPFIWWLEPKVASLSLANAALMASSGILYMGAMLFYLRALQSEEASVVAPFFQAAPLFGFVLGYAVLGETLSPTQIAGGALIVGGTVLVSRRSEMRRTRFNWRLAALMLACALSLAVSSLIFKIFALSDEFWPTTFWMFVGEAIFGAALLGIASFRRQFIGLLRSNTGALLTINGPTSSSISAARSATATLWCLRR